MRSPIRVRRVYEDPPADDGRRVLVDRLWPRGLSKEAAALDDWLRDVAPSAELRTWYGHEPARFAEFRRRYLAELTEPSQRAALGKLRGFAAAGPLTLLTATKDTDLSQAAVLAGLLNGDAEAPVVGADQGSGAEELGGDRACWAHLVCPDCGAVVTEGHAAGCQAGSSG
jgi:uncharacterized protein YeaO (DUF488 family)